MTDYVERGALIDKMCAGCGDTYGGRCNLADCSCITVDMVLQMPAAADVVEVIRCKDCKWFGKAGCAISIVDETDKPKEDDFCSFAEREADNGAD